MPKKKKKYIYVKKYIYFFFLNNSVLFALNWMNCIFTMEYTQRSLKICTIFFNMLVSLPFFFFSFLFEPIVKNIPSSLKTRGEKDFYCKTIPVISRKA